MNLSDEIQRLAELHASGVLNDEEFVAAKQRLLAGPKPGGLAASFNFNTPTGGGFAEPVSVESRTNQWAMWLHLSQLAGFVVAGLGFIAPIVIWQTMKDEMPALDAHGKMAVNWMISMFIYAIVCIPLCFIGVGIVMLAVLAALGVIFPIIGGIKASEGILWRYPLTIRFIR